MVEHTLKGKRDAFCRMFIFRRDLVNSLSNVSEQVETRIADNSVPSESSGCSRETGAGSSYNM